MAKKKKTPPPITSLENSRGYSGRLHAGTFSGATRDATSLLGNAVFAETLNGLQKNAESRAADYDLLRQQAGAQQSGFEKFGTAVASGVGKGIINGMDGIVSLVPYPTLDDPTDWNWDVMSDDFSDRSMLSNYLTEGSKAIGMQMPIYDSNPYNFYTGLDAALTSVGEFAIPGKVISKGVGLAAKGVGKLVRGTGRAIKGATQLGGRMSTRSRLAKFGARTDDFLTKMSMSPKNQAFFQTVGSGYMMNRFEGTVMGHQVYEETMDELSAAVAEGQLTEEEAQSYANQAALSVRNKNAGMMLTDMFAMYGIFKAKGMTRNLLTKPGFTSAIKNNLLNKKVWNPLNKAAARNPFYQALVEGGEEVLQSNIQKQSKYDSLKAAETLATSRVGKEEEAVYVPDSDSYYERLKDNLFSKDAAFEGAIGFFSGPIQSIGLGTGLGVKPLLDNVKYKNYTKEITALEQSIRPGGTVKNLGKQLKVKEQIEDLKLKRAQETQKGAYEEQQRVISEIKDDVKRSLKETINMEDLVEEVQEKGVEGVEELLEGTAFVNTAVKHFQNGTTENLERMLKDLAEGKGDPATFGENTQQKAADLLTEMQEMEKQWLRYYNFENKAAIFSAIQNEKEVDKALNRSQTQKEDKQAAILAQLNQYAPANNYGFDQNGNLVITPKSEEERKLDEDLPGEQTSLFPSNDDIREYFERMPEKLDLDEINQTQNVLRETKDEVGKFLNTIASGKGQRAAKKARKKREKAARRAAKRAIATNKAQVGERSKAKTTSERSATANAEAKVKNDGKVKVKPTRPVAPPSPPAAPTTKAEADQQKEEQKDKKAEDKRRTTPPQGRMNKENFDEAVAAAKGNQSEEEPVSDDQNPPKVEADAEDRTGFTKATDDRSSVVQGYTDGISRDSENAFWTFSDPSLTAEGDEITFQVEDADVGVAADPSTGTKGLKVVDVKGRKKEIAEHENSTYGSNISEDQAADDVEAIAIYHNGNRVGYVGSPLSVSSKRREMSTEEMLEEKENLRSIRAEILAKARNGETVKGTVNSIDLQFTNWKKEGTPDSRSIDVFGDDVIVGIATSDGVTFQGGANNLTQAANQEATFLDSESIDGLFPGMAYAFIPVKKDKNGVTYYQTIPLLNQNLNTGFVDTVIYALKSWAGGIDPATDKENREEASATLQYNLTKKTTLSGLKPLLNRFFFPRVAPPDVPYGQTRNYIYLNRENPEDEVIELVENIGGQPFVRGTIRRGTPIDERTAKALPEFLANEQVQLDLDNIEGIPLIITDQEGNVKKSEEKSDFRNHLLKNTTASIVPVESVLDATGRNIYSKAPKVSFSVDTGGERTQDTPAPAAEQEVESAPWEEAPSEQQKLVNLNAQRDALEDKINEFGLDAPALTAKEKAKTEEDLAGVNARIRKQEELLRNLGGTTTPTAQSAQQSDEVEAKKADIERRRKEAFKEAGFEPNMWPGEENREKQDEIEAKYDAELAALEQQAPTTKSREDYAPDQQVDEDILENLDDDMPSSDVDDLVGDAAPVEVKEEHEKRHIKGLTPTQNSEILGHLANAMFRKLVKLTADLKASRRIEEVSRNELYKEALKETMAAFDSYISRLEANLGKEHSQQNGALKNKIEARIAGLKKYKQAIENEAAKVKDLAGQRLEKFEGVTGQRSEEDLENIEETAHERRNFGEDFFLKIDSKKSTSKALRKFLSTIPLIKTRTEVITKDGKNITVAKKAVPTLTTFGSPKYADFDSVYNKLHSLEVGSDANLSNQLTKLAELYVDYPGMRQDLNWLPSLVASLGMENVMGTKKNNRGEERPLADVFLEQALGPDDALGTNMGKIMMANGFGTPADEKIRRQFAINMSKAKVKAPLVLYRPVKKGGKITFEVTLTDHNSVDNSKQILNEMQEGFLNKLYTYNPETEEYEPDELAFDRAIKILEDYKNNPPTQKNSDNYKEIRKQLLEVLGIPISTQTFHTLATKGYRLGKNHVVLSKKNKNVFKTPGTPFRTLLDALKQSKNKPFNTEVNIFTDNAIKNLAQMESLSQTATLSNAFRVGENTIYTYTEHNYATSQIQNILTNPEYREKLKNTVFAGESLWLHMMSTTGGEILEVDGGVDAGSSIDIGILNFRPVKERKESNLTTNDLKDQNLNDNIFTRLAMFTANASTSNKSIQKNKNEKKGYSFKSRKSTTVPLTYSDKHAVLTVTTDMPVFTIGKGGGVTSDTINMFYEHVLMSEITRIQNMYSIGGSNDEAYDAGKSAFHLMPEMNNTTVKDRAGETDTVANWAARGAFDPSSADYDEDVVNNTKRSLGDQLNKLINEQVSDFEEAGINISSKANEASFVSTDYINMLKGAHGDVKLEGSLINKAIAADYTLNHMLSTANMFQLFVKDPAFYTKTDNEGNVDAAATLENIQKRLAAVIAPGTATAQEEKTDAYVQLFANDIEYSEFLGDSIKDYFKGIKNKKHRESYAGAEITDGQELITYQEFLGTMVSQGQITKAEKRDIEKIIKNPDADIPDWMMDVLFGAEKPVAVADKFVTIGEQQVEKRYYIKSSGLPLIPKFTKGTDLENLRKSMEEIQETSGLPVRLAFGSAVKVGLPETAKNTNIQYTEKDIKSLKEELPKGLSAERRNEEEEKLDALLGTIKPVKDLVSMFKGKIPNEDLNTDKAYLEDQSLRAPMQILQRKYWRIQQATPNKNKDIATRGSQESKIILSEVTEAFGKEAGGKIIEDWNNLHSKLFGLRAHQLGVEILNPDGSIDREALAKFLDREANDGGVSDNTRYGLQVDQNGEYIIPLDLSPGTLEYQTLINAVANSRIAQKKVKGQSTVLMTEFGFAIKEGQDLSESGIVWTQGFDFKHGKLKPARIENGVVKPAQVILPNKFFVNGKKVNLKKYIVKGEQEQMILDTNRMPAEVLKGFGFRIPTQGYNSMAGIEIVGFLPESMGDVVVAPGSFVKQMGSDFDIDKLFNYFYKLEEVKITRKALTDLTIAISDEMSRIESGKFSLEEFKEKGFSEEEHQAHLEDINAQIEPLEKELQDLKSKRSSFVKITADDLKDKSFNELNDKEIERLENALLNEALDLRLKIMGNQEIYQTMSAPLDFGLLKYKDEEGNETGLKYFFKEQRMSEKASSRNPLTPAYHTNNYQDARGAGDGVGVFARSITFQSMAQSGRGVIPGSGLRLGRFKSNKLSDSKTVTNNKRTKIGVFTAFLSASLDNEKEKIMNYLNINSDTFYIATGLIHSGFEEDLTLAFLESPVLRLLAENKKSRTKEEGLTSGRLVATIFKDIVGKSFYNLSKEEQDQERDRVFKAALAELEGNPNETKEETFNRLIANSDIQTRYSAPIPGVQKTKVEFADKQNNLLRGDDLYRARLLSLGTLVVSADLKTDSTDILASQRLLNVDSGGLGKNAHEAYSKLEDFIELSGVLDLEGTPHPIFTSILGDARVLFLPNRMGDNTGFEGELKEFKEREDALKKEGFVRIARVPGEGTVVYLKPASASASIYAESMGVVSTIYEDTMPTMVDFVLDKTNLANPAIPSNLRFIYPKDKKSKIVHDTLRSILFASTEDWVSGQFEEAMGLSDGIFSSPVKIRETLMYGDNTLAMQVKEGLKDPRLSKNPFLKSLVLSTKEGERHKVTFANFTPDGMMEEDKSDAFSQLFLMPDQSPIGEGGPTPAQLGALLVTYAMVTGGNQRALEFVRFVPNSYLVGTGFYKNMKGKLDDLMSTNSKRYRLEASITTQLIQHNPRNTYRKLYGQKLSKIEGTNNDYNLSGARVTLTPDGVLQLVDNSGESITYLHSVSKKGNVSLYYFNPDLNSPGKTPVITRIDVLGDGGDLNEFSAGLINEQSETALGISIVPANKKGYIEEVAPTRDEREGPTMDQIVAEAEAAARKVKVTPEAGAKVSRKLELNPKGESNPVATIQAIAMGSDSPMFKQLSAAFLTRQEDLEKIKFETTALEDGKNAGGSYTHSTKTVKLDYSNDKLYNEYAILHEFGHALTKDAVEAFEKGGTYPNAKVKKAMENIAEVQKLYVEYLEAFSPEEFKAFNDRYKEYVRRKGLSKEEKSKLPSLDFSNREELGKFYGGTKLSEFVTMVLSDEFLQRELDQVLPKLEGAALVTKQSLFQELLQAFKDILEGLTGVKLSDYTIEQAMTIVRQGQDPVESEQDFDKQVEGSPKAGSLTGNKSMAEALSEIDEANAEFAAASAEAKGEEIFDPADVASVFSTLNIGNAPITQPAQQTGGVKIPSEFTNHSGGALGADSMFDTIGKEFGQTNHKHYYYGSKTPKGNVLLTESQVKEGVVEMNKAAKILGKKPSKQSTINLLARNWFQVKNSSQVIAIAPIDSSMKFVEGGTGWAVAMAQANNKEINVFNLKNNSWYKWNGTTFIKSSVPALTKNFAGIGSRKITEAGKQAIRDVYETTFSQPTQQNYEASNLSDLESGEQGTPEVEKDVLRAQLEAMLPEPDPNAYESKEEYNQEVAAVKASKEYKDLLAQIEGKPTTQPVQPTQESDELREARERLVSLMEASTGLYQDSKEYKDLVKEINTQQDLVDKLDELKKEDDLPTSNTVDLGMDITDFLKQLTPDQRKFYNKLFQEGQLTVKCRRS